MNDMMSSTNKGERNSVPRYRMNSATTRLTNLLPACQRSMTVSVTVVLMGATIPQTCFRLCQEPFQGLGAWWPLYMQSSNRWDRECRWRIIARKAFLCVKYERASHASNRISSTSPAESSSSRAGPSKTRVSGAVRGSAEVHGSVGPQFANVVLGSPGGLVSPLHQRPPDRRHYCPDLAPD